MPVGFGSEAAVEHFVNFMNCDLRSYLSNQELPSSQQRAPGKVLAFFHQRQLFFQLHTSSGVEVLGNSEVEPIVVA